MIAAATAPVIDPKARTAAIGAAYVRDRKRFTDTVAAILSARRDVPGLDAGDANHPFDADEWAFTFAGVPFRFALVPAAVTHLGAAALAFEQVGGDGPASGLGWVTFDAEGRTGNVLEGYTLPRDAVPVLHALLAARFANYPLTLPGVVDERLSAVEHELTSLPETVADVVRRA